MGWSRTSSGRLRSIEFGCLVTSADLPLGDRLAAIHACVAGLIATYQPVLVGVERLFFSRNVQTAFAVGQARGVVLLAAAQAGVPVREATPNEVKLAVAGYGSADKDQVQRMVAAILGLVEPPRARRRGRRPGDGDLRGPSRAAGRRARRPAQGGRPRPGFDRADHPGSDAVRASRPRGPGPGGPMIASVEGSVGAIAADSIVVEVAGIGYRVFVSPAVISSAAPGSKIKLHTFHLVRDDLQALYGFRTPEELGFFNLLLSVTGVGPKVALAITGSRPVADLQLAIIEGDQAMLTAIPGIGKRLAERVIFELKEKVAAAGVGASVSAVGGGEDDVVAALQALGYSLAEARDAARAAADRSGSSGQPRGAGQGSPADAAPELAGVRVAAVAAARGSVQLNPVGMAAVRIDQGRARPTRPSGPGSRSRAATASGRGPRSSPRAASRSPRRDMSTARRSGGWHSRPARAHRRAGGSRGSGWHPARPGRGCSRRASRASCGPGRRA